MQRRGRNQDGDFGIEIGFRDCANRGVYRRESRGRWRVDGGARVRVLVPVR